MGRAIGFFFILLGLVGLGMSMADRSAIESLLHPKGSPQAKETAAAAEDESADAEPVAAAGTASPPPVDRSVAPEDTTVITELEAGDVNVIKRDDKVEPEKLPWVDVSPGSEIVREDSDHINFVLTLSEPAERPIIIIFSTVDGSAQSDEDYLGQRGTVTFKPGIVTAEIRTPLVDDQVKEGDEQFGLVLNGAPGIVNLHSRRATATIRDND